MKTNPFAFVGNISKANKMQGSIRKTVSKYSSNELYDIFQNEDRLADLGYRIYASLPMDIRNAGSQEDLVQYMVQSRDKLASSKKNKKVLNRAGQKAKKAKVA